MPPGNQPDNDMPTSAIPASADIVYRTRLETRPRSAGCPPWLNCIRKEYAGIQNAPHLQIISWQETFLVIPPLDRIIDPYAASTLTSSTSIPHLISSLSVHASGESDHPRSRSCEAAHSYPDQLQEVRHRLPLTNIRAGSCHPLTVRRSHCCPQLHLKYHRHRPAPPFSSHSNNLSRKKVFTR